MKDPIQFTDIEKYLVSYYRAPSVSSWIHTLAIDGGYLTASVFFIAIHLTYDDIAWGVIGYLILLYRLAWGIWQARRWTSALQGIMAKYEARIAELEKPKS